MPMSALQPTRVAESARPSSLLPGSGPGVKRLTTGHEATVLDFLSRRPLHTAYMAGLIHANGLENPANRGEFYAYRNLDNSIEGVALIGHAVTFEASSEAAIEALARRASLHSGTVLLRGERDKIESFWRHYSTSGRTKSTTSHEILLELNVASPSCETDYDLRTATPAELEQVVAMNVELTLDERGVNPLEFDPQGFRQRLLRRISRGQIWVWTRREKVIFKADVITRTPDVVYLEGIYVHRDERGKGHGVGSMRRLGDILLKSAQSLCLFVNERNWAAQALYRKAGYRTVGHYDTIYLQEKTS